MTTPFMSHVDTRGTGGANGGYVLLPPSRTVANAKKHTHAGVYRGTTDAPLAPCLRLGRRCLRRQAGIPAEHIAEPVVELDLRGFFSGRRPVAEQRAAGDRRPGW